MEIECFVASRTALATLAVGVAVPSLWGRSGANKDIFAAA